MIILLSLSEKILHYFERNSNSRKIHLVEIQLMTILLIETLFQKILSRKTLLKKTLFLLLKNLPISKKRTKISILSKSQSQTHLKRVNKNLLQSPKLQNPQSEIMNKSLSKMSRFLM